MAELARHTRLPLATNMAMTHVAASITNLTYACDTHYPWQEEEVVHGGRIVFEQGAVRVPTRPGLGVKLDRVALARLHEQYLGCGVRNRDDLTQMRKYEPGFTGKNPRF
jgi:glucarate dehydratase